MNDGLIAEIKARLTIEEALSHFGVGAPSRGRDPVMIRCPWHQDRSPSLAVYRRQGRAWCYGCRQGGDIMDVTALFLRADIREAVNYWAERLGLSRDMPPSRRRELEEERRRKLEERKYRAAAQRASRAAEAGLPRPRPEDLEDPERRARMHAVWAKKRRLDRGIDWVYDRETYRCFASGLAAWKNWALETL